ncbi:chemokine-like factor, isoform CRA_b [Rattus norvegicus]|uniref:Chemokine-like factor, isoform CRA_b n=2 Tax=Rattus norvegicus TaxID=10116 RepID=A6JXW6_RAT|nr:chemokine-like factor isoform X1 [Rattus norvegicus]AAF69502.1 chemokine-like factor 1 [Rattus norvegicus]EDL87245.1 chemokine-like factor, isoform CRA_b [Rattus norvegicus]
MDSPQKVVDHQPFCLSLKCFVKTLRLDVINSVVTTLFMLIVSVSALIPETSTMIMVGGVFGFLTVICTVADCALMCQKLRFRPHGPYQNRSATDVDDS